MVVTRYITQIVGELGFASKIWIIIATGQIDKLLKVAPES
jgi:hypothetical protein